MSSRLILLFLFDHASKVKTPDPITFGEGSFNKGFYFQIPLDFFSKNYNTNYYNFEISPLTRDGGAKLRQGNKLEDIIHSSSYSEIYEHWKDFLN